MKTIVIGIDGATWKIIDPLMKRGKLPNFKKICEGGVKGTLKSTIPPSTYPAWKCYSTGRKPENVGVFGWRNINWGEEDEIPDSEDFDGEDYWNYLGREGFKVGSINMPGTYPPKEINGYMVSGPLTPDEKKDYTYPSSFKEKIKKKHNYKIEPDSPIKYMEMMGREKVLKDIEEIIDSRFELAKDLLEECDFIHLTLFWIDGVRHHYWNKTPTVRLLKKIDGWLSELGERDLNIVLFSDHGFQRIKTYFNLEYWLEKKGYISSKESGRDIEDIFVKLINKLNLAKLVSRISKKRLKKILSMFTSVKGNDKEKKIKHMSNFLCLSPGIEKREETIEEIIEEMKKIEDLEGDKILKEVKRGEEVFDGKYIDNAPDIVYFRRENTHLHGDGDPWGNKNKKWIAAHDMNGIFAAYGPSFKENTERDCEIIDIAPTLLNLYDLNIPDEMDGEAITDILTQQ